MIGDERLWTIVSVFLVVLGLLCLVASIAAIRLERFRAMRILVFAGVAMTILGHLGMNLDGYRGIFELPRIAVPVAVFVWVGYEANRLYKRKSGSRTIDE